MTTRDQLLTRSLVCTGIRTSRARGLHLKVFAVSESSSPYEVSEGDVHDYNARRSGASGACSENGGEDGVDGAAVLLLREYRGRAWRGGDERAEGEEYSADVRLFVATVG